MKEAFYNKSNQVKLSEEDRIRLSKIFNWLIGEGIDINKNKGLFMTGTYGTGKSVILKGILSWIEAYYSIKAIESGIASPMYVLAQDMANFYKNDDALNINRMKSTSILAIDDIGYEPTKVNHFGTEAHPFEEILMARYDRRKPVLITSNLTLDQIGEHYGWHINDRLKEMVYVLEFKGDSKR